MAESRALPPDVELVVFDMAGTTVNDLVDGEPLVIAAFRATLKAYDGTEVEFAKANEVRGYEKKEALKLLMSSTRGVESEAIDEAEVDLVYKTFEAELEKLSCRVNSEIKGTSALFQELRGRGIKVCVGSGFPEHLGLPVVCFCAFHAGVSLLLKPNRPLLLRGYWKKPLTPSPKPETLNPKP